MAKKRGLTPIPTPTHIVPSGTPRLIEMELPRRSGYSAKRSLWVPTEINDALTGQTAISDLTDPAFAALIQEFVAGLYVTGSPNDDPQKRYPEFERLANVNEVWVMAFRAPKFNQWRLMGRFLAFDNFVGLGLYRRSFLDGQRKYQSIALAFDQLWQQLNSGFLVGTTIEDYISKPVRDPYVPII